MNGSASAPEQDGWHLADFPATTASPEDGETRATAWRGSRWPIFKLALWTGLLTILTLGLYRFWARTRIRRWYWSAIRPGGFPIEYVGTPYEKLLGFLVAVVILAFYLGVVNLILMFASFSLLSAPSLGYLLTFLGVIPIWFFAYYRAQRYLLARTRWMGIRFGLAPGAWGYAGRATWHWLLTVLTLGAWHPRLRFALAKYRHDRTYFGTHKMNQGGTRGLLYPAFVHVLIGGVLTVGTLLGVEGDVSALFAAIEAGNGAAIAAILPFWRMLLLSVPWLLYGLIYYAVEARRLLVANLKVGEIGFDPRPRVGKVVWITLSGNFARYFGALSLILAASFGLVGIALARGTSAEAIASADDTEIFALVFAGLPDWLPFVAGALLYFAIFLLWNVLTHIFLRLPTWRHYADTLAITGAEHLGAVEQRARDESREAGGFAEALDVGAAI